MKYISIDIETSGLNPENCQILSFAAIIEDTNNPLPFEEIPKYHCIFDRKVITGEPFALDMNKGIITAIKNWQTKKTNPKNTRVVTEKDFTRDFLNFLVKNQVAVHPPICAGRPIKRQTLNIAGKNFGVFDKLFIEKIPQWNDYFKIHQRILDPSILFVDWANDELLPNLSECKKRSGMDTDVSHVALEDAWYVIQLMRKHYQNGRD